MAIKAKEALGIQAEEQLIVLAGKGYHTGKELQKCHEAGIETLVSEKKHAHDKKDERFQKKNFAYNAETDTYICPEKKVLTIERTEYEPHMESNKASLQAKIPLYKKRQSIVEHPFGTIKRQRNMTHTI
jgi:hypothetical protein